MVAFVLLIQAVAFGVLSAIIASSKNRNAAVWGSLGFLFGLFTFIAALVVEEVEPEEEKSRSGAQKHSSAKRKFNPDEHEKKCPDCAEFIKLEARVCKHCGREFSDKEVREQVEKEKSKFSENKRKRVREKKQIVSRRRESKEVSNSLSLDLDSEEKKMIGFLFLALLLFAVFGSLLSYL